MNISYTQDLAFQATHVIITNDAGQEITLTTGQALSLLTLLERDQDYLEQREQQKREHRQWLEGEESDR